jgi:hypothetical protein
MRIFDEVMSSKVNLWEYLGQGRGEDGT